VELKLTGAAHKEALRRVPCDWARVSATKQVERFHTPTVLRALSRLELAREKIRIHTRLAWVAHLRRFAAEHGARLAEVATLVDTVDALQSLARVAAMPNYCRPRFVDAAAGASAAAAAGASAAAAAATTTTTTAATTDDDGGAAATTAIGGGGGGGGYLEIVNGRHPIVEVFNTTSTAAYVPNSITMGTPPPGAIVARSGDGGGGGGSDGDADADRDGDGTEDAGNGGVGATCILLTGPNMGGKSCLVRMVGLAVLMAQAGCYVAADRMTSTVFDGVYTRMGSSDSILSGMSTFLVEMSQAARILARATPRSLVILDELGRGTSNLDGEAIAFATLRHCVDRIGCLTVFITHYPNLSACGRSATNSSTNATAAVVSREALAVLPTWTSPRVRNMHMAYLQEEDDDDTKTTTTTTTTDDGAGGNDVLSDDVEALIRPVTFLYRAVDGPAPMSYGINVARMAGVRRSVLLEAARVSAAISSGGGIGSICRSEWHSAQY
jgi:DNA mismatch repair protein MSH3